MEQTETTEFAARIREAILEDGKLQSTILDLVCSCASVLTQIGGGEEDEQMWAVWWIGEGNEAGPLLSLVR